MGLSWRWGHSEEDILGEDSIMFGSEQEGPVGLGWAGTFRKPLVFGGRSKVHGCLGRWWSLYRIWGG